MSPARRRRVCLAWWPVIPAAVLSLAAITSLAFGAALIQCLLDEPCEAAAQGYYDAEDQVSDCAADEDCDLQAALLKRDLAEARRDALSNRGEAVGYLFAGLISLMASGLALKFGLEHFWRV